MDLQSVDPLYFYNKVVDLQKLLLNRIDLEEDRNECERVHRTNPQEINTVFYIDF